MSRVFAHESQCSNVFGHVDVHPEPRRTGCTSDSTACRWVYWVYGVLVPKYGIYDMRGRVGVGVTRGSYFEQTRPLT